MTTGKTIALTRWTFIGKVMSLLFTMLSRLFITFLPRSKCLLSSWLQSAVSLEPKKIVSDCFHCFLMKVKEESEKAGLKLNIHKTKSMASGPITSWQIDGETMETVTDFMLGASKSLQMVTAAMKLKDTYSLKGKL